MTNEPTTAGKFTTALGAGASMFNWSALDFKLQLGQNALSNSATVLACMVSVATLVLLTIQIWKAWPWRQK